MADKVGYLGNLQNVCEFLLLCLDRDNSIFLQQYHSLIKTALLNQFLELRAENSFRSQWKDHQFDFVSGLNNVTPV